MNVTLLQNPSSISEDLTYTFFIEGISNVLFQELMPYKKGSHTIAPLEKLKKEYSFSSLDSLRASKYIVMSKDTLLNEKSIKTLEELRISLQSNPNNDIKEESLPAFYKRSLNCSFSLKKLQELISSIDLESTPLENKHLSKALFRAFPKEQRKLFDKVVIQDKKK